MLTQFNSFRDNMAIRLGLRTSSWQVSELCLGAGAYSEGLDTSTLLPQYKGVGILRGAGDLSPTVRTYLADGQEDDARAACPASIDGHHADDVAYFARLILAVRHRHRTVGERRVHDGDLRPREP